MREDNIRFRLPATASANEVKVYNPKNDESEKKDGLHQRANCVAYPTKNASLCKLFLCLLLLHFAAFIFNMLVFNPSQQDQTRISTSKSSSTLQQFEPRTDLEKNGKIPWDKYENCTIQTHSSYPQKEQTIATEKPLWAPSFPNSLDDKLLKNLIHQLTGLPTGAKSYYAQRKGLRKCQGGDKDTTILCHVVHPIIKTNPQDLTSLFNKKVIYITRNFITAFPVYLNYKAIKYHNHPPETQISVEEWRKLRDLYLDTEFQNWKGQLYEWKKRMKDLYSISLYLPFEKLMDEQMAPRLLHRLIQLLNDSGFPVVVSSSSSSSDDDSLSCAWYKSFGRNVLEQMHDYGYEYSDYVPGYTQQQKEFMMRELLVMMEENMDDQELVLILKEYQEYVERYLSLDQPWSNDTVIS